MHTLRYPGGDVAAAAAAENFHCGRACPCRWQWLLLYFENPDDAALWDVVADADIPLRQIALDALGVDAPAGLDGDVLRTVDLKRRGRAGNAGIGRLLPEQIAGLGVEARGTLRSLVPPTKTRSPPVASTVAISCHRKLCCQAFLPVAGSQA